jgi:cell division protein FtsN
VIPKDTLASNVRSENTHTEPATATLIEPVKADTTHVSVEMNIDPNNKYHVVAGCFAIEENAVKFVASLQQQNLNAAIIGKNNKGLYVVSCGDFATRKEANEELSNLRKLQPNAWLYKN